MEAELAVAQGADRLPVLLDVGDQEDLLDRPVGLAADVLDRSAEVAGEADLVLFADGLIAEDQHAVVEQRTADLRHGRVFERQPQVQPADLRAQGAAGRDHLDSIAGVLHGWGVRGASLAAPSLLRSSAAGHSAGAGRVPHSPPWAARIRGSCPPARWRSSTRWGSWYAAAR